jgi:UDP-glucose 4-epimerase
LKAARRFLITGGAGFIGSHLTHALTGRGDEVVVLDDLSTGDRGPLPPQVRLVVGSVEDADVVADAFRQKIDGVFHLAAFAAEGISHAVKRLNYSVNILGSVNLINAALRTGVEFFGFASSVAVYGAGRVPMTEDDVPVPVDSYGNAKLAVERELAVTMRLQGLPYFALRMHNVYGEWQNMADPYRNAVAIFMNQILRGEPITVYGDGGQIRAFTYVRDVVRALVAASDLPTAKGNVLNVGATTPTTVLAVADEVRRAMGRPDHPIVHLPARDEVRVAYTDNTRAVEVLGYWPETPLTEGIGRAAAWARARGPVELRPSFALELPDRSTGWLDWISDRLANAAPTGPDIR